MAQIGIDISNHKSQPITQRMLKDFDLIVPMTTNHALLLLQMGCDEGKVYRDLPSIGDPFGGSLEKYCICRDEIIKLCEKIAEM